MCEHMHALHCQHDFTKDTCMKMNLGLSSTASFADSSFSSDACKSIYMHAMCACVSHFGKICMHACMWKFVKFFFPRLLLFLHHGGEILQNHRRLLVLHKHYMAIYYIYTITHVGKLHACKIATPEQSDQVHLLAPAFHARWAYLMLYDACMNFQITNLKGT